MLELGKECEIIFFNLNFHSFFSCKSGWGVASRPLFSIFLLWSCVDLPTLLPISKPSLSATWAKPEGNTRQPMARELRRARKYNFIYKHNRNILNESRKRIPTEHNTNTGIEFAPQIFFLHTKISTQKFLQMDTFT